MQKKIWIYPQKGNEFLWKRQRNFYYLHWWNFHFLLWASVAFIYIFFPRKRKKNYSIMKMQGNFPSLLIQIIYYSRNFSLIFYKVDWKSVIFLGKSGRVFTVYMTPFDSQFFIFLGEYRRRTSRHTYATHLRTKSACKGARTVEIMTFGMEPLLSITRAIARSLWQPV